jgi:hypothetical protein
MMTDGIGDLNSTEQGSAARNNANKPRWALMPLLQIGELMSVIESGYDQVHLYDLTLALGNFQKTGKYSDALVCLELGYYYLMNTTGSNFDQASQKVITVWEAGEKKYAAYNWMKGMPWTEVLNSAQRHVIHMFNGNQIDNETGEHHAAHFICNCMMLVHYIVNYPEGNDLPCNWFK